MIFVAAAMVRLISTLTNKPPGTSTPTATAMVNTAAAPGLPGRDASRVNLPYFLFTLIVYYGGNAVILRSNIPTLSIARFGERRRFRGYERPG